jgi:uncharacterized protein DUF4389
MSDASASPNSSHESAADMDNGGFEKEEQEPLWQRLLYMAGFWFLGNIAFSLSILLGAVQLLVLFLGGSRNEELAKFSRRLVAFVFECLSYITFDQDDKPFPFGPFPADAKAESE